MNERKFNALVQLTSGFVAHGYPSPTSIAYALDTYQNILKMCQHDPGFDSATNNDAIMRGEIPQGLLLQSGEAIQNLNIAVEALKAIAKVPNTRTRTEDMKIAFKALEAILGSEAAASEMILGSEAAS